MRTWLSSHPFFCLWLACIVGSWCVLPYVYSAHLLPQGIPLTTLILISTLQSTLIYGLICGLSALLIPYSGLSPFRPLRSYKAPILIGMLTGAVLLVLDHGVFSGSMLHQSHGAPSPAPLWARLLASTYGALNEEVLVRLFFFSLIYSAVRAFLSLTQTPSASFTFWAANIISSLSFGLFHLPAAVHLGASTPFELARILCLNGVAGLIFGGLYYRSGLFAAMIAHGVADWVVHGLGS